MRHLIVGRTSHLGQDLTELLIQRGDDVVGTSRQADRFADIACDVRSSDDVKNAVDSAAQRLGGIDSLIYLAGYNADMRTEHLSEEHFRNAAEVNMTGAFRFAQCVLSRDAPCCVTFVGTANALRGSAGQAAYATTKAALIGLTRSLAAEFGPRGRRVNLVAPGYFVGGLTDGLSDGFKARLAREIPLRRLARIREISATVAFIAGPESSYMNGSIVYADGGLAMGH